MKMFNLQTNVDPACAGEAPINADCSIGECGTAAPGCAPRKAAFSLVEIALALAIIGVGLLSVFGLLSAALNTSRDARDDYQLGLIVNQIVSDRRGSTFDAVSGLFGITELDTGGNDTLWFHKDGGFYTNTPAPSLKSYYRIYATSVPIPPASAEFHLRIEYPAASARSNVTWFSTIIARTNPP